MPLARVRTDLPSIPAELEHHLRASGFDIEVARSNENRNTQALIELTVDILLVETALRECAALDANVYVAPGVVAHRESGTRSAHSQESQPIVEQPRATKDHVREQQLAIELSQQEALRAQQLQRERDERRRSERVQVEALLMQAEAERLRRDVQQEQARKLHEQQQREIEAERKERELQARVEREAQQQRQREEAGQREGERLARPQEEAQVRQRIEAERIERERQARLEFEAHAQQQRMEAELRRRQDQEHDREREKARRAQLREREEQKERIRAQERRRFEAEKARILAEEERLRTELQHRQEEIAEQQRVLKAEREHFEREREIARQAVVPPGPSNMVSIAASTPIVEGQPISTDNLARQVERSKSERHEPATLIKRKSAALFEDGARRMRHKEYRQAAITAAVLTIVIMCLWVALASRRAADPLATPTLVRSNGIQQQKPFGAATIAAPVQVQQNLAPDKTAAPEKRIAATHPVASKPSPAKRTQPTRRTVSTEEQDVVVRHFGTNRATAKKKTASKDGIKVFSDLE